jgi:ATP-dependent RNA helicase DeaD
MPGNIVGAIANEAGLSSKDIGRINIFDSYSTVDLPKGMPDDIFKDLKNTWVASKKLNITREAASGARKTTQKNETRGEARKATRRKPSEDGTQPLRRKPRKKSSASNKPMRKNRKKK